MRRLVDGQGVLAAFEGGDLLGPVAAERDKLAVGEPPRRPGRSCAVAIGPELLLGDDPDVLPVPDLDVGDLGLVLRPCPLWPRRPSRPDWCPFRPGLCPCFFSAGLGAFLVQDLMPTKRASPVLAQVGAGRRRPGYRPGSRRRWGRASSARALGSATPLQARTTWVGSSRSGRPCAEGGEVVGVLPPGEPGVRGAARVEHAEEAGRRVVELDRPAQVPLGMDDHGEQVAAVPVLPGERGDVAEGDDDAPGQVADDQVGAGRGLSSAGDAGAGVGGSPGWAGPQSGPGGGSPGSRRPC